MSGRRKRRGEYTAYVDGSSKRNPGPTGIGVVIKNPGGLVVDELSEYKGLGTNNTAEWEAVIRALTWATSRGDTPLSVRSDSKLVVNQMRGSWKSKDKRLRKLRDHARDLAEQLPGFRIDWIPREKNEHADLLARYGSGAA